VAAITGRYVVDLRADDEQHESQSFLVDNLIAMVAKRHSKVQDQEAMNKCLDKLELRDPQVFLPRMGKVVDALVGEKWWFDRDVLRSKLPD
jgi:DNA-directed RNA polymerase sigma subunit (sigma70/sigma32)